MMKTFFFAWIVSAVVFLVIDAIWLGLVATSFYRRELGDLMLDQPKLSIAALFYLMYSVAIVLLASMPAAAAGSVLQAIGYGAVLGFAAYGTYDITNLSTLKGWPVSVVIVDIAWGTALTAVTATCGYAVLRYQS